MGKIDFINQLKALGYNVQELPADFVTFEYEISVGKFKGQKVCIGLRLNVLPNSAPLGPHFKPLLLPITGGGGQHPYGAIHNSPLGPEWEYWSRPFRNWDQTDRTAKNYLAHINNLLIKIQ